MGINVDRTIVTTFAIGGAMAGVAALSWALLFRSVDFTLASFPGIKAFTAAVLGGSGICPVPCSEGSCSGCSKASVHC